MNNRIQGIGTYFGGKGGSGTYQAIINKIPPHSIYVEPFLGAGAIMRYKKPALINVGMDLDYNIINSWVEYIKNNVLEGYKIIVFNGIDYLRELERDPEIVRGKCFIYCDPPYLIESRSDQRPHYLFEMNRSEHENLLRVIKDIKYAMIAISCYKNDLYAEYLKDWNCYTFNGTTRGGSRREFLYMNYPEPTELHDYSFLGNDFIDRGRIKKKINRHIKRLKNLPILEQKAILSSLKESFDI